MPQSQSVPSFYNLQEVDMGFIRSFAALAFAVLSFFFAAGASYACPRETIYITDVGPGTDGKSSLYSVKLDETAGRANLTLLGTIPFNEAEAAAVSPDGSKVFIIDKFVNEPTVYNGSGRLGYFEVSSRSWYEIGPVTLGNGIVEGIAQAAFSPVDGKLYCASDITDSLYTVDPSTGQATLLGRLRFGGRNINATGGDLAFTASGILYFYANFNSDTPRGMYILNLPAVNGTVASTYAGAGPASGLFTGMAFRFNGYGDLLAASGRDILDLNSYNANLVSTYPMYLNGAPLPKYYCGDMAGGPDQTPRKSIGYWKRHSWDGATVILKCACCKPVLIDEALGKQILCNARGTDLSMLFAQLIAARLNTMNIPGFPEIDKALAFLCKLNAICDGTANWQKPFASCEQRREAAALWEALDRFNSRYECGDEHDYHGWDKDECRDREDVNDKEGRSDWDKNDGDGYWDKQDGGRR
jgi:hypothetical protein